MSDHKDTNKVREKTVNSHENHRNKFTFQLRTIVPSDLNQIQPRASKVWNCDEIGFEPNGKWHRVVCTYKFFQGGEIGRWKLESAHHSGAHYLYSQELMGSSSCLLLLFTNPRSTPNIYITTSHWTVQSIKHHLATWIETGGLRP